MGGRELHYRMNCPAFGRLDISAPAGSLLTVPSKDIPEVTSAIDIPQIICRTLLANYDSCCRDGYLQPTASLNSINSNALYGAVSVASVSGWRNVINLQRDQPTLP